MGFATRSITGRTWASGPSPCSSPPVHPSYVVVNYPPDSRGERRAWVFDGRPKSAEDTHSALFTTVGRFTSNVGVGSSAFGHRVSYLYERN